MGFQYIIILSIFLTQLCAKDYEMSSIRKVTFLEGASNNSRVEKFLHKYLPNIKCSSNDGECKEKYININLISEIKAYDYKVDDTFKSVNDNVNVDNLPKFFIVKFATNYSQNSSDLELVIDEPSLNEILK